MAEQRMTLEEAGKLLGGLHPNTVRERAKKGKIPYEKDNTGKWFVFLDPDSVANDPRPKLPKEPTMEPTMEAPIVSVINTLEATIVTLREELEAVRTERDGLRAKADEKAEIAARLEIAMATISAKGEAAAAEIERLRAQLDRETDENRKKLVELLERMAQPKEQPRKWWQFGRSA